MGLTKTEKFTEDQNALAVMAKAFAHPARIAIVQHLMKAEQCINSHLVSELGLAQATVSQHLRELKELGIIQGTIEGTSISYCIDPEKWQEVQKAMSDFFNSFQQKIVCC